MLKNRIFKLFIVAFAVILIAKGFKQHHRNTTQKGTVPTTTSSAIKILKKRISKNPRYSYLRESFATQKLMQSSQNTPRSTKVSKISDEEQLKLVDRFNSYIDEQEHLFGYLNKDLDFHKLTSIEEKLAEIEEKAKNKNIWHLIDHLKIKELRKQLNLQKSIFMAKNKNNLSQHTKK